MAVFGIGAYWDSKKDMTKSFISREVARIGWKRKDAKPLYNLMSQIKLGDIIYIKAQNPSIGLTIKAVGIVKNTENSSEGKIGVKWIWNGKEVLGKVNDRYHPARNLTLYEELSPDIQNHVLDLLLSRFPE